LRAEAAVVHCITTRDGPDFGGPADGPALAGRVEVAVARLGFDGAAWADQVHGGAVTEVDRPGLVGAADGLWTGRSGLALLGRSADCPLVLIAARVPLAATDRRRTVGLAHASWRSTAAGITGQVARALVAAGTDPRDLIAAVGPSAGPCCYEVGDDVRAIYRHEVDDSAAYFTRSRGRLMLDLWSANRDQLRRAGVPAASIHIAGICTICRHDIFASHRAEQGRAGRFAGIIGTLA
jgi:YfiH family protein